MNEVKKILLLNPPGRFTYLRDYYCSSIPKAGYYWQPIDLLVLSGILHKEYKIYVIDAIVQKQSFRNCQRTIEKIKPDIIVFLSSVLSHKEDFRFIKEIWTENILTIGCGDIFLENPQQVLKDNFFIKGIISDWTDERIPEFLKNPAAFGYIIYPGGNSDKKYFKYPIPAHKKFPLKSYRYPCNRNHPFVSILTNYGCPYKCHFCNSGNLGFRIREINNILEELKYVVNLGISQVFFKDMTFGADRGHAIQLCKGIIKENIKILWNCYSRTDIIDEEMICLMKKAGCYLVQFGVENIDLDILKRYGKKIPISSVQKTFNILKEHNILTGAHFLFGLPNENPYSTARSIRFAKRLNPDYVSFNIFSPRKYSLLSNQNGPDVRALSKLINIGYIQFYLRPGYIINRLLKVRTFFELKNLFYMGISLMRNVI